MMEKVLTVTFNPTVDAASEAEVVRPTHKIRTFDESFHPGGGGINVARVVHRLGGDVKALYASGGIMGNVLNHLLEDRGIQCIKIAISGNTRVNNVIHERASGMEYRFIAEGPIMKETEWKAVIDATKKLEWDWIVVSGSLPRNVPIDVYDMLIDIAKKRNARIVIDTSGDALKHVLDKGGVTLVKPSQGEFEACTGKTYNLTDDIAKAAQEYCIKGASEIITVTLGHQGAVLATKDKTLYLPSPHVRVISASGAGDSFVAGMVQGLALGWEAEDAFRLATACGTAAVAEKGNGLCQLPNIKRLYNYLARKGKNIGPATLSQD
ncbi:1-phosphofructokinase family hexose kinase [Bartonella sp. M0283]|uniref:1-phosphofructokinase family hexose kinase n=1 Tax=Bartonella sp. M0283 TaxID=2751016 RepID=UPI0018DD3860|nr:1-phosphofructokinase family hexose kinase [Bartonella sp. M0283]MBI0162724.1 1-phosphofructokinase family hexose kinase [Bartonella sp. M0283]